MSYYQRAKFLLSAAKLTQLPDDVGYEVAFAGRSNAGKSSTLNTICQHRGLAKASKTPGRTQLINVFELDEERRLIDLPGYGYAKVSRETKERWQETLGQYLQERQCLRGLMLVMDIRHPLKDYDQAMIEWSVEAKLPVHILLNKADKLSRGQANNALLDVRKTVSMYPHISVQLFSALKNIGLIDAEKLLDRWLCLQPV